MTMYVFLTDLFVYVSGREISVCFPASIIVLLKETNLNIIWKQEQICLNQYFTERHYGPVQRTWACTFLNFVAQQEDLIPSHHRATSLVHAWDLQIGGVGRFWKKVELLKHWPHNISMYATLRATWKGERRKHTTVIDGVGDDWFQSSGESAVAVLKVSSEL